MNDALGISANIGVSVVFYLVGGVILFLLVGILVTYFCSTRNLFARKPKTWNLFTKIYYLYIPLTFAFIGGILGGLYGLNNSILKSINNHSDIIIESSAYYMSDFQLYLNDNLDSVQIAGFSVDKAIDDFFENDKAKIKYGFLSGFQNKLSKWVFRGFLEGLMVYSAYKIGVKQSNLELSIQFLSEFDIKKADIALSKILVSTIKKQLNTFFYAMYINQIINLLLILLLPIAETIFYFIYMHNKKAKPATGIS